MESQYVVRCGDASSPDGNIGGLLYTMPIQADTHLITHVWTNPNGHRGHGHSHELLGQVTGDADREGQNLWLQRDEKQSPLDQLEKLYKDHGFEYDDAIGGEAEGAMSRPPKTQLHVGAAKKNPKLGDCYRQAYRALMDSPEGWTMIHGDMLSPLDRRPGGPHPNGHAALIDPENNLHDPVSGVEWPNGAWQHIYNFQPGARTFTKDEARREALDRDGDAGPWHDTGTDYDSFFREAAVNPFKTYLPWADLQGLTPKQAAFQRTHPVVRQKILNDFLYNGEHKSYMSLAGIHEIQNRHDRMRASEGKPSPYTHPSLPQPWHTGNPTDQTMQMQPVREYRPRHSVSASAIPDESGLKAAGIAVIAMDTGRVLMQQRALNPLMCPCGLGVTWDESNGYQHDDGSISHDDSDMSVSEMLDQGHPEPMLCPCCLGRGDDEQGSECTSCDGSGADQEQPSCDPPCREWDGLEKEADWQRPTAEDLKIDPDDLAEWQARNPGVAATRYDPQTNLMSYIDPDFAEQGLRIGNPFSNMLVGVKPAEPDYRQNELDIEGNPIVNPRWDAPYNHRAKPICQKCFDVKGEEKTDSLHDLDQERIKGDISLLQKEHNENPHELHGSLINELKGQIHDYVPAEPVPGERRFGAFQSEAALEYDPNEGTWEFPGGKLDPGETAKAAAVREFREEVGQDLPPGVFVGAWLSPGGLVVAASSPGFAEFGWKPAGEDSWFLDDPQTGTRHSADRDGEGWHLTSTAPEGWEALPWQTHMYQPEVARDVQDAMQYHESEHATPAEVHQQAKANSALYGGFGERAVNSLEPKNHPLIGDYNTFLPYEPGQDEDPMRRTNSVIVENGALGGISVTVHTAEYHSPPPDDIDWFNDQGAKYGWKEDKGFGVDSRFYERKLPNGNQHFITWMPLTGNWLGNIADSTGNFVPKDPDYKPPVFDSARAAHHGLNELNTALEKGNEFDKHRVNQTPETNRGYRPSNTVEHVVDPAEAKREFFQRMNSTKLAVSDAPFGDIEDFKSLGWKRLRPGLDTVWEKNSGAGTSPGFRHRATYEEDPNSPTGYSWMLNSFAGGDFVGSGGEDYGYSNHMTPQALDAKTHEREGEWLKKGLDEGKFVAPMSQSRPVSIPDDQDDRSNAWGPESTLRRLDSTKPLSVADINPAYYLHPMRRLNAKKVHAGWPESSPYLTQMEKELRRSSLDLISNGGVAWHIAHPSYQTGSDLIPRNDQPDHDVHTPWKWGDDALEGFDGDSVALFPDTSSGREGADQLWRDYPDHTLVRVSVPPEHEREQNMRMLDEGYPAVVGAVPASWIEEIQRGYSFGPGSTRFNRMAAKKAPVYKGFIYLIQRESDIDLGNREHANPDDPDGDMTEQSAWWDIEHAKKNPALRVECKKGTPWDELELWADKSVRSNREVTAMVAKLAALPRDDDNQAWRDQFEALIDPLAEQGVGRNNAEWQHARETMDDPEASDNQRDTSRKLNDAFGEVDRRSQIAHRWGHDNPGRVALFESHGFRFDPDSGKVLFTKDDENGWTHRISPDAYEDHHGTANEGGVGWRVQADHPGNSLPGLGPDLQRPSPGRTRTLIARTGSGADDDQLAIQLHGHNLQNSDFVAHGWEPAKLGGYEKIDLDGTRHVAFPNRRLESVPGYSPIIHEKPGWNVNTTTFSSPDDRVGKTTQIQHPSHLEAILAHQDSDLGKMAAIRVNDLEADRRQVRTNPKRAPELQTSNNSPTIWTIGGDKYLEKVLSKKKGENEFLSSLVGRALGADVSPVMLSPRGDIRASDRGTILTRVQPEYKDYSQMSRDNRILYENNIINSLRGVRLGLHDALVNVGDHGSMNHGMKPDPTEPHGYAPHGIDYETSMQGFNSYPWISDSPYAAQFISLAGPYDNLLTQRDVFRGRRALENLAPAFQSVGRKEDHNGLLDKWDILSKHAQGEDGKDVLPEKLPDVSLLRRESQPTSMMKFLPNGDVVHSYDSGRGRWVHRIFSGSDNKYPMAVARSHETALNGGGSWQELGYQPGYPRHMLGNPPEKQPRESSTKDHWWMYSS